MKTSRTLGRLTAPAAAVAAACLGWCAVRAQGDRLGLLPAGMSPDAAEFTSSELYVLDRGTVSVFELPGLAPLRTFGGSGRGPGLLSPAHSFDQALRVVGDRVLLEDNDKLITYSRAGQLIGEQRKPENSVWFVPFGSGFAAKSMVVEGTPPLQVIRLALYDSQLREVKELYRQPWFQQRRGEGFSTALMGDLLHFAVAGDRVCVEESPRGFVIDCFDAAGTRAATVRHSFSGVPVTAADREREMALVRTEKRVALMIARAGSWETLRGIWDITFPVMTPPLREIHASGNGLLVRTFERKDETVKFLLVGLDGTRPRELWLPAPSDAETEARVSGTAFFRLVGDRYYYLRHDPASNRWEVHATRLSPPPAAAW